jgi:hypothetical protein
MIAAEHVYQFSLHSARFPAYLLSDPAILRARPATEILARAANWFRLHVTVRLHHKWRQTVPGPAQQFGMHVAPAYPALALFVGLAVDDARLEFRVMFTRPRHKLPYDGDIEMAKMVPTELIGAGPQQPLIYPDGTGIGENSKILLLQSNVFDKIAGFMLLLRTTPRVGTMPGKQVNVNVTVQDTPMIGQLPNIAVPVQTPGEVSVKVTRAFMRHPQPFTDPDESTTMVAYMVVGMLGQQPVGEPAAQAGVQSARFM